MFLLLLALLGCSWAEQTCEKMFVPEPIVFSRPGDLKLAYVAQLSESEGHYCDAPRAGGAGISSSTSFQYADLLAYAVAQINQNDHILPNVTLGFTVLDGCTNWKVNLARVWTLLLDNCHGIPDGETGGKLVGMVGPLYSLYSVIVSGALGMHRIPHIGIIPSSDELSDKSRFEYFQRMVPPDRYQTDAMMDILEHFGWTYFSFFYQEGSYGENAIKLITRKAAQRGMCIGYQMMGSSYTTQQDYHDAVSKIAENRNNRVILSFQYAWHFKMLMNAITEADLVSHFVLLGGDSRCMLSKGRYHYPASMICITFPLSSLPAFTDYYVHLDPFDDAASPWLPKVWEEYLGCSWTNASVKSCHGLSLQDFKADLNIISPEIGKIYDAVFVFAYALHQLIADKCPEVFVKEGNVDDCVDTRELMTYIRSVEFEGHSGKVQFDENGDILSGYGLGQIHVDEQGQEKLKTVGEWHFSETGETFLEFQQGEVSFKMYDKLDTEMNDAIPISVCSLPCEAKQYYRYEENMCCWECRTCRSNEYIGQNHTECFACPEFTWPDEETALTCEYLPVTTLGADHPIGTAIFVTGAAGCFLSILVMAIMFVKRESRLVKACSRELSAISLFGTLLASVTAFLFVLYPSDSVCISERLLFHMSVSVIFTPILAKTSRVYRIFSSGKKSNIPPRFISPKAQLVITGMLLAGQCFLLALTTFVSVPFGELHMPVPTVAYVEQHCVQALWAFLVPLTFNIIILLVCAVFGFLTRKLPENFNESWFIFLSVAATLLMWALMLPTYFTAFYAYLRAAILAFCLLFNVFLTLTCQYGPKMYAALFVREENIVFGTSANTNTTQVSAAR